MPVSSSGLEDNRVCSSRACARGARIALSNDLEMNDPDVEVVSQIEQRSVGGESLAEVSDFRLGQELSVMAISNVQGAVTP
jgi:hypothetical protein